jgi:hypothetical protein
VNVSAQSVELGDGDPRAVLALRSFDRGLKLRPRVQSVSAFAGFNLDELMNDFKVFHLGEGFELGALRFACDARKLSSSFANKDR